MCFLLLAGCSESGSGLLAQTTLEKLKPGMTLAEIESIIRPNTTMFFSFGTASVYQWVEGENDNTKSITVNFENGKLATKAGTNLSW